MKRHILAAILPLALAVSCDQSGMQPEDDPVVESISIVPSSVELTVGDEYQLTVEYFPEDASDKTAVWSCSPSGVVDVDQDGKVVALAPGEAVVTAACGEIEATCSVVVKEVAVETVELNKESAEIFVGETVQLSATVLPADVADLTVSWSSSDPDVASVDDSGLVAGLSAGETLITAVAGGVTAECSITVKEIPVSSIELDPKEKEIEVGQSFIISATVKPDNAGDKTVVWSSENEDIAKVDGSGTVTGISEGNAVILAHAGDVTAECLVTVVAAASGEPAADIKTDWTVGEFFDYAEYGKGVVFEVGDSYIKVVSLVDNTIIKTFSPYGVEPMCTDLEQVDGKPVTDALAEAGVLSDYPAADWAHSMGEFWYLPTIKELAELYSQASVVNSTLSSNGSATLPMMVWSCIESDSNVNQAYAYVNGSGKYAYNRANPVTVIAVMKLSIK